MVDIVKNTIQPPAPGQEKFRPGHRRGIGARAFDGLKRAVGSIMSHRIVATLALIVVTVAALSNASAPRTIVAFGDSYFSGYGLDPTDSFPAQFERALREHGRNIRVLNQGVPGETIADGLARLDRALAAKPALIILELGANDAEQRLDPAVSRANLDRMLARIHAAHVRVLLCGAIAPTEYGEDYQGSFDPIYSSLAAKHRVPLYPFILDGVASDSDLIQDDGEHPNEKGVQVMVERILPVVEKIVR
jgi:acyl-CoA thioesterase-1